MKKLMILDAKNYKKCTKVLERWSTRAVIRRGNKIAMQQDSQGIFKMPGGSVEKGETYVQTLMREVAEETGLLVIEDSIMGVGEVEEIRQDIFDPEVKYICHTLYYLCDVKDVTVPLSMTESEIARGFHLSWATLKEIYETNSRLLSADKPCKDKDMCFIKHLIDCNFD